MATDQVQKEQAALHEPSAGRVRLLPSRRPVHQGPARREARPTEFDLSASVPQGYGAQVADAAMGAWWNGRHDGLRIWPSAVLEGFSPLHQMGTQPLSLLATTAI